MSLFPVAWITHPACLRHEIAPDHPESPRRLMAIEERLHETGLYDFLQHHQAPAVRKEALLKVHDSRHVERVMTADTRHGPVPIDDDTAQSAHTLEAALHAAGAGILGVDLVMDGKAGLAFCCVRPPGHHAERTRAMGFCFFNNVAVAAAHARSRGLKRIAILDFDLHYGNGTADIFAGETDVWLYSTYQHPLYPHWSGATHAANLVDVPLPAYADGKAFRHAVAENWMPALEKQKPELILVSAGFDAHADDPLGDLRLQYDDYHWIGKVIHELAEECCAGRVVAMLEGGYNLMALARSVEAFLQPFFGEEFPA